MAPLTLRVRTPARMLRVSVDENGTVGSLRQAVAKELGVASAAVGTISLTPAGDAPLPDDTKLLFLGAANGSMFYCTASSSSSSAAQPSPPAPSSSSSSSSSSIARPSVALTPRCQHGPGGACHHCLPPTDEDFHAKKSEPLNMAGRFAARHVERSAAAASDLSGDMEWLCRHRPDAMCVNCAPLHKGDKVELPMLCLHGPEARCTNCLPPDTTVDNRKFITWGEWCERRKARCEHAFTAFCVNCAPPRLPSYAMKPGCGRHPAWPRGICLDCSPAPVDLASQPYRHVDYVQVHAVAEMSAAIQLWDANRDAGLQRAGILYGRYTPDSNFRHGVKAVVEAIYEPPQRCDPLAGTVQLLAEGKEKVKARDAVASALGLIPVGWMCTRRPPSAPPAAAGSGSGAGPTGEAPLVSPFHLLQMAAQQLAHPRSDGLPGSQFACLIVTRSPSGSIEPQGFMASDQLVALARDGVLAQPASADEPMFRVRQQNAGEPPLPDVIRKDTVRGRYKSTSFEPEFTIVTLEAGTGRGGSSREGGPLFRHATFPVENRTEFGIVQTADAMKKHLLQYRKEPYHHRLSDFHALVYLAQLLDTETAVAAAQAVTAGTEFSEGLQLIMQSLEG